MKLIAALMAALFPASRPARGAWIETGLQVFHALPDAVAPRAGRVD